MTVTGVANIGSADLDAPYVHLLGEVTFTPIFVLGLARSGTTLLYKLLAQTGTFNHIQAYHIINYDEILCNHFQQKENEVRAALDARYRILGVENRIFDRVPVSSTFPGEYRVILQNKGEILNLKRDFSEYLKQCLKGNGVSNCLFNALKLSPASTPLFMESCKKVQLISDLEKPLLLKNPYDFSNFIYLKTLFPTAKFIFIHRDPIDILNSQLKALHSVLGSKNAYLTVQSKIYRNLTQNQLIFSTLKSAMTSKIATKKLLEILCQTISQTTAYFNLNLHSLSQDDYFWVTYEELCHQPEQIMAQIFSFLDLRPTLSLDYEQEIAPRPRKLLPLIKENSSHLSKQLKDYIDLKTRGKETKQIRASYF